MLNLLVVCDPVLYHNSRSAGQGPPLNRRKLASVLTSSFDLVILYRAMAMADGTSKGWLRVRLKALRAFSFPVSVLPVPVAVAVARGIRQWNWPVLAASVAGVALLHAAGNLLNDYFDFRSGVDSKKEADEGRPGRLLVRGQLAPRDVFLEAMACLLLAACAAAWLVWQCGPALLWFGAGACVGLYAYTGPPFQLKYRAMGEPLIFLVFGPVLMLGAAYAQTGQFEWRVLMVSIPVGFATTAVLFGNNIRDQQEDRAATIVTLAHLVGPRAARWCYITLVAASALGVAVLAAIGLAPRVLLAAPVLLVTVGKPLACVWCGRRLPDIDARTARFVSLLLVFFLLAFVFEGMW